MKKYLLLFGLVLFPLTIVSQGKVSLSLQQDARLFLVGDQRGNSPLTTNLLAKVEIPVYHFNKSHMAIYPVAEYADLVGGNFQRYAIGAAYAVDSIYGKIGVTAFFDYGYIKRSIDDSSFNSFSLSGELSFRLTKNIKIICTQQLTERRDLTTLFNSDNQFVISGFIGLKFSV